MPGTQLPAMGRASGCGDLEVPAAYAGRLMNPLSEIGRPHSVWLWGTCSSRVSFGKHPVIQAVSGVYVLHALQAGWVPWRRAPKLL
eukprot:7643512-Prorocentrum_lima.AAC.1